MNTAKCLACNKLITNVHFEGYNPSMLHGGSASFVAIAFPCGHAIGSVPVTWEEKLGTLENNQKRIVKQIDRLEGAISDIDYKLRVLINR